jgi:hypothetical protein
VDKKDFREKIQKTVKEFSDGGLPFKQSIFWGDQKIGEARLDIQL